MIGKTVIKKIDSAVSPLDSVARETLLQQLKGELMRVPSSEMCEKLIFAYMENVEATCCRW